LEGTRCPILKSFLPWPRMSPYTRPYADLELRPAGLACPLPCHHHFYTPFTRYNRLSNRLYSRLDNRLDVCLHDAAGCSTGCTIEQPVVQPVSQPQPVGCLYTRYNLLSNRLSNRSDNRFNSRLHRVNGVLVVKLRPCA